MTDPFNGNGLTRNPDGSIGADPSSLSSTDTTDDWASWPWPKIEAFIVGSSEVPSGAPTGETGKSIADPQTLWDAAQIFYGAQQRLQMAATSIEQQAEALAGTNGPWTGDGATAFLAQMKSLSSSIKSRADQLSGGSTGLDDVPIQLYNNGNYLQWAQQAVTTIDTTFASAAGKFLGTPPGQLVPIHLLPNYVTAMTQDMVNVGQQLTQAYVITINNVLPVDTSQLPSPNGPGGDNGVNIPDLFPPDLFPPPPNVPAPDLSNVPPPNLPDVGAPPPLASLNSSVPPPNLSNVPPPNLPDVGAPPPLANLNSSVPPPNLSDIGAPPPANLSDSVPPPIPVAPPTGLAAAVPPPIPDLGAPNLSTGGPSSVDGVSGGSAGGAARLGDPATTGLGDNAGVPGTGNLGAPATSNASLGDLANPADLPAGTTPPGVAGAGASGGMPMMPGMGGAGAMAGAGGADRSDASGLLAGDNSDFGNTLPDGFGVPNAGQDAAPPGVAAWAADPKASALPGVSSTEAGALSGAPRASGPGTDALPGAPGGAAAGGMPMMPGMGGAGAMAGAGGADRSDASGLLAGHDSDFGTRLPDSFGQPSPTDANAARAASWAPEPSSAAVPPVRAQPAAEGLPMMPGDLGAFTTSFGAQRSDASGVLAGEQADFGTRLPAFGEPVPGEFGGQLPAAFGEPAPVDDTVAAARDSWAAEPSSEDSVAVGEQAPRTWQPMRPFAPAAPAAWMTSTSDPALAMPDNASAVAAAGLRSAPPSGPPAAAPTPPVVAATELVHRVAIVRAADSPADTAAWNVGAAGLMPLLAGRDNQAEEPPEVVVAQAPRGVAVAEPDEAAPAMAMYRRQRLPSVPGAEEPVARCGSGWPPSDASPSSANDEDGDDGDETDERSVAALLRQDDSVWGGANVTTSDWLG